MSIYEKELTRLSEHLHYIETSASWRITKVLRIINDKLNVLPYEKKEYSTHKKDAHNNTLYLIYLVEKSIREKINSRCWRYTFLLRIIERKIFNYSEKIFIPFEWWNIIGKEYYSGPFPSRNLTDEVRKIINKDPIESLSADIRLYISMKKNQYSA